MLESLIVIVCSFSFAVASYRHLKTKMPKVYAKREACVLAGFTGAIFAAIGMVVMIDNHQSWNNWLTSSLIVVGISWILHHNTKKRSRHAA